MELVLNLIWCAVVAAASYRFARWAVGRPAAQRRFVGLATICVLALRFPIISATDDIHLDPAMAEETSGVPRSTVSTSSHLHHILSLVVHSTTTPAQHFALSIVDATVPETTAKVFAGFARVCSLRGPPSSQR